MGTLPQNNFSTGVAVPYFSKWVLSRSIIQNGQRGMSEADNSALQAMHVAGKIKWKRRSWIGNNSDNFSLNWPLFFVIIGEWYRINN